MVSQTQKYRSKKFLGVKELVVAVGQVFQEANPDSWVSKSDIPNERTIRFYLNEGLLPRPDKGRKQLLPFDYSHLITVLLIKRLQALGLSISVIEKLISGKSMRELEKLLDERIEVFTSRRSRDEFIETQGKLAGEDVVEIYDADARNDYLGLKSDSGEAAVANNDSNEPNEDMAPEKVAETWSRITITEGLEIHINDQFRLPTSDSDRQFLLQAVEKALTNI